jgi:thiol-disulfide isomerase/thioredoxin
MNLRRRILNPVRGLSLVDSSQVSGTYNRKMNLRRRILNPVRGLSLVDSSQVSGTYSVRSKRLPLLVLILTLTSLFLFSSCKKENTTTTQKKTTPSSSYSPVKSSDGNVSKERLVDFSWSENGTEKKLSDYEGRVILLNFWATWCGPCRREIPDLNQISKELDADEFKIIGVSIDQNPAALENYLRTNPISYTVVHEQGDLISKYMQATGNTQDVIPQSFLIDKNGKIVETIIGARSKSDFLQMINKYL